MDKKDGQVGAGVVEQSPDHFRSIKLMFIRLKPTFEIKQYLYVKKESLTPGLKRPLSLPVKHPEREPGFTGQAEQGRRKKI